jgi:hypothetical protein
MVELFEKPLAVLYARWAQIHETDMLDGFYVELRPATVSRADFEHSRSVGDVPSHEFFE